MILPCPFLLKRDCVPGVFRILRFYRKSRRRGGPHAPNPFEENASCLPPRRRGPSGGLHRRDGLPFHLDFRRRPGRGKTESIRTYPFSDPDPVPIFARSSMGSQGARLYPYFVFDRFTAEPVEKSWTVVRLKNPYVEVAVLPQAEERSGEPPKKRLDGSSSTGTMS